MRLTIKQALDQGYTIDYHVYPHYAYKGPRFAPSSWVRVYTELEGRMLAALRVANDCASFGDCGDKHFATIDAAIKLAESL